MSNRLSPPIMESAPGAETIIDGRRYLYFGGTSYLGLAGRPEVIEAACEAARRYGIHSATSRTGFGTNPPVLAVERLASEFFGKEESFYYVSGYVGNHILIQALAERCDIVVADELAHFCLCEASKLLGKPIMWFRHRDVEDLASKLNQCVSEGRRPLVMSDGLFAATGAIAPLDRYIDLLEKLETATLLIDDAHGFGAVGENGRGTLEHFGLWGPAETEKVSGTFSAKHPKDRSGKRCLTPFSFPINGDVQANGFGIYVSGTLSKSLGGFGGILAGSAALIDRARATSHYHDGASAPASPVAGAAAKALEIVLREPELRKRLQANVARLRRGLGEIGLLVEDSPAPIIGVTVGNADNMRRIHLELKNAGFILPYSTYSGAGKEGTLRIAVFATHTDEMLDRLLDELQRVV